VESLPSRDKLESELRRRGLPPAYIARLAAELDDHYSDLVEERSSRMGAARKLKFEADDLQAQLGEPTQLAVFAAEQYHARNFWGRHPLLTFLVGPLPLLVGCWFATGILFFAMNLVLFAIDFVSTAALGWSFSSIQEENHPFCQAVLLATVSWIVIVLPPLVAAWLLCRVARRNGLHWKWPVLGCGLLAIVAAASTVNYRIKTIDAEGLIMVGLNAGSSAEWLLLNFLPRFALAMAIGLLLVRHSREQACARETSLAQ
jgi:hypothetical protein